MPLGAKTFLPRTGPSVRGGSRSQPITKVAREKIRPAAPAKSTAAAPAAPALADAAKRFTGAYSGSLNNISDAEQRVRDVAARRTADADKYQAYVLGKQGSIAAAAGQADDKALAQTQGVARAALGGTLALQAGLQTQRDVQGGAGVAGGPLQGRAGTGAGLGVGPGAGGQPQSTEGRVPAQQLTGLVDSGTRAQMLLSGLAQQSADKANTNRGKAGFLAAAAQDSMMANKRAIAGQEFEQLDILGREKTGVLNARTENAQANSRAKQAAAASIAEAQIRASEQAADRASRESIASGGYDLRRQLNESDQSFDARQKAADRASREGIAKAGRRAGARGKNGSKPISPAEQRARDGDANKLRNQTASATAIARNLARPVKGEADATDDEIRAVISKELPGVAAEALEAAIANARGNASTRRRARRNLNTAVSRRQRGGSPTRNSRGRPLSRGGQALVDSIPGR